MAESAANVFTDGLNTDQHPLTALGNTLTDALNATFVTYNGNELILQNDMGNTLIQDTQTGNVMGLSEGFVPVGMKEYGGILYIASYNPDTKEGEIGTIPSPRILMIYNNREESAKSYGAEIASEIDNPELITDTKNLESLYLALDLTKGYAISDYLSMGDQFIPILDLDAEQLALSFSRSISKCTPTKITLEEFAKYPVITKLAYDESGNVVTIPGWYNIKLYIRTLNGQDVLLPDIDKNPLEYYIEGVADMQRSDYWFILRSALEGKTIDFNRCQKSTDKSANVYRKYPNVPKGKLIIKIEPNLPYDFKCVPNLSLGANTLFSRGYRVKEEGKDPYNNYIVNIPSLTYKSVGPIWVDKVEVSTLGTPFLIYKKDGTCVSTSQTTMELKKLAEDWTGANGRRNFDTEDPSDQQYSELLSNQAPYYIIPPESTFLDRVDNPEQGEDNEITHYLTLYSSDMGYTSSTNNNSNENFGFAFLQTKNPNTIFNLTFKFYTQLGSVEDPNYLLIHTFDLLYSVSGISVIGNVEYEGNQVKQLYYTELLPTDTFDVLLRKSTSNSLGSPIILNREGNKYTWQTYNSTTHKYVNASGANPFSSVLEICPKAYTPWTVLNPYKKGNYAMRRLFTEDAFLTVRNDDHLAPTGYQASSGDAEYRELLKDYFRNGVSQYFPTLKARDLIDTLGIDASNIRILNIIQQGGDYILRLFWGEDKVRYFFEKDPNPGTFNVGFLSKPFIEDCINQGGRYAEGIYSVITTKSVGPFRPFANKEHFMTLFGRVPEWVEGEGFWAPNPADVYLGNLRGDAKPRLIWTNGREEEGRNGIDGTNYGYLVWALCNQLWPTLWTTYNYKFGPGAEKTVHSYLRLWTLTSSEFRPFTYLYKKPHTINIENLSKTRALAFAPNPRPFYAGKGSESYKGGGYEISEEVYVNGVSQPEYRASVKNYAETPVQNLTQGFGGGWRGIIYPFKLITGLEIPLEKPGASNTVQISYSFENSWSRFDADYQPTFCRIRGIIPAQCLYVDKKSLSKNNSSDYTVFTQFGPIQVDGNNAHYCGYIEGSGESTEWAVAHCNLITEPGEGYFVPTPVSGFEFTGEGTNLPLASGTTSVPLTAREHMRYFTPADIKYSEVLSLEPGYYVFCWLSSTNFYNSDRKWNLNFYNVLDDSEQYIVPITIEPGKCKSGHLMVYVESSLDLRLYSVTTEDLAYTSTYNRPWSALYSLGLYKVDTPEGAQYPVPEDSGPIVLIEDGDSMAVQVVLPECFCFAENNVRCGEQQYNFWMAPTKPYFQCLGWYCFTADYPTAPLLVAGSSNQKGTDIFTAEFINNKSIQLRF